MATATYLSQNDQTVLGVLFDAEGGMSNTPPQPTSIPIRDQLTQKLQRHERQLLLALSNDNPDRSSLESTVIALDQLIAQHPAYASAYNNRAQTRRLMYSLDELAARPEVVRQLFGDLDTAIQLASPSHPHSGGVTADQATVLSAAHTHRASLLYEGSKRRTTHHLLASIERYADLDADSLQELASLDFAEGGRYGHGVAKQMAVMTNPYAKLCGEMVKQAMQREMSGSV
ncbi:hypothetical protein BAUCODRAFT_172250 [Baudoinia panamericana UAMH 10762]|uniref:Uncharacterized protein n=1 Tax=Baudoinia panamericana (strain UAMH 10762) TaxID=717646 RepID=M2NMU3_BAUPA|nr:uncharacterized protein BAUCODRAFT_172250 [Baudoinia panamericana UAMH 10762]EMD00511.1 hypothetical protein BAUCODRAFT_172250 [Baudoinia panamericana UAMH 10762]